jgi:hypothetical protein
LDVGQWNDKNAMSLTPACENVIAKVKRSAIRIGGANGIRALSRALGITVDDSPDVVPHAAFVAALGGFGIALTAADQAPLWQWLDRQAEGTICPTEFITALRTIGSAFRRALVMRVLDSLPRDGAGNVAIAYLLGRFDASVHPAVVLGELSEADVEEHIHAVFGEAGNPNGAISCQEVEQYFSGLSAVIDLDERFAAVLRGCWRLDGFLPEQTALLCHATGALNGLAAAQPVATKERVLLKATMGKVLDDTIAAHRAALLQTSAGFRAVGCALRKADVSQTGFVSRADFVSAIGSVRLYLEHAPVLELLDTNANGTTDYVWYLAALVGELSAARRLMVERLWKKLPVNGKNMVTLSWLHKNYVAEPGQELSRFLDAWDARRATGAADGGVAVASRFELLNEWMVPVSAKTSYDAAFESYLAQHWPVE